MKHIIAFVGMAGSGKTIATQIAEKEGFSRVHFGSLTMEELKRKKMPISELNEKIIREELRTAHGMGAFAVLALDKIDTIEGDVVIDGLYSWAEYKILKEHYKDALVVVAIYSSPATRIARVGKRQERPLTADELKGRDRSEIENIEKGGPIAVADYTIINEGSQAELETEVKHVIRKITG
ncbi:MAG: AAA family ATPase [Nanoarchaeota archaeon]